MNDILATAPPARSALDGPLRPQDLTHYDQNGWLVARGLFTEAETADIASWTEEVCAWPEAAGRHMVYYETSLLDASSRIVQRVENFCPYHAGFDRLVRGGRLLGAVEQLLRAPALLFKEKVNFKKAGGAGFEPHQDQQAGWSTYAPSFVTALVSIDPATVRNGCLEMSDAPRYEGMLGQEWVPLTADQMASFRLIPVETEPGDVLFFDSYAPHGSQANLTAEQRRILYLTYNAAEYGDHRAQYYADKRKSFPPEIEREPNKDYRFRV